MQLLELAWRSLLNRKVSVSLALLSITFSVAVVIGVEHIRSQTRENFNRTISGVDLVVGARTSQLNLLLYAIFRIGNATNNVSEASYERIKSDPRVAWSIPLVLGDSHQGYRVLGTNPDFFVHMRVGQALALTLREGSIFSDDNTVVLGSEVARRLGYQIGSELAIAHGLISTSFSLHQGASFVVAGILQPTGTPIDQTIHVSLNALARLHDSPHLARGQQTHEEHDDMPESITAFLLGLHDRSAVFALQRDINEYGTEALTAIIPGVALAELWQSIAGIEQVLALVSAVVMLAALLGLATMLLASMHERRREIALYRALGAHASTILLLVELEALLLSITGVLAGFLIVFLTLRAGQEALLDNYGLMIDTLPLNHATARFVVAILLAALVIGLLPAIAAYRASLASGLRQHS
ncbi:MAG: ABC transporter permease [Pseudohongiellaceae bacterium]|jgi:putative ABC transport system permease protein